MKNKFGKFNSYETGINEMDTMRVPEPKKKAQSRRHSVVSALTESNNLENMFLKPVGSIPDNLKQQNSMQS